ncbi:heterokaryon incompatibility protein-domain-containing protein [Whalleya microplaca]|nr:heterokaryon incompatibility protein-domain-containing protein [Whalleya microplaca]
MSVLITTPALNNSNNASGRASRAWNRPMEIPVEDRSLHLCARHRIMNLQRSDFAARPRMQSLPPDWHFGTLWDVVQRSDYCVFCRLIADTVSTRVHQREVEVLGCWIPDVEYSELDEHTGVEITMVTLRLRILPEMIGSEGAFEPFYIVPLARENGDEVFMGRTLDAGSIDIDLLKTWLRSCEDRHNPLAGDQTITLIKPSSTRHFIALSYVWGRAEVFKTLKGTLQDLMASGSLERNFHLFPKTIRDAISVTRLLGHRYLWIDSLCIVQDDYEDKYSQVMMMDSIYRRASCTIVAASGDDANAGLPGVEEGSRHIIQHTAIYSDELTLLSLLPGCGDAVKKSTWNGLCWTYQERLLSRRLLIFTNDTVYFTCGKSVWSEDFNLQGCDISISAAQRNIVPSRAEGPPTLIRQTDYHLGTSLVHYFRMVAEYTSRAKSYPNDRGPWFEGIMSVLWNSHGAVYSGVMWVGDKLIHALLWQPCHELRRMTAANARTNGFVHPSWSWAGWLGAVKYDDPFDWNGLPALQNYQNRSLPSKYCKRLTDIHLKEEYFQHHYLKLHARISRFKLTLRGRHGPLNESTLLGARGRRIIRFGITRADSVDVDAEDAWIGTILLPSSFRQKLSDTHEFAVLSDAYCFSSEELSQADSQALGPYSAVNAMLITRKRYRQVDAEGSLVERAGVGRIIKGAWEAAPEYWESLLIE